MDMLNCYYAHGDEKGDSRLQRRCYWLLEADEDIVLVHYLNTAMVRRLCLPQVHDKVQGQGTRACSFHTPSLRNADVCDM